MIKATNLIHTGIAWVPEIPSDWELKRIKLLFDFNKHIVGKTSADYDVLSLTTKGVIKRDLESGIGKFPASFDGYQIVKPNSIMLCLFDMDVTPRVVGHVDDDGIISAAYTNIIPKKGINSKYYYYYFLLQDKNKSLLALGTGIRITLNKDFFGTLKIPIPPLAIQNSIVAYLDKKNNEIDKFIRNKVRLIEILEEQKKSEITRVIIEGINDKHNLLETDVPYMPLTNNKSKIKKLKYIASLKGRIGFHGLKTGDFTNEGPFLITGTDFIDGKINWDTCVHITIKRYKEDPYIQLKESDFLITKDGTIGKTAIIENLPYEASLNSGVMLVRSLRGEFLNKYLFWIINSRIFDEFVEITKTGSTIMHLYQHSFGNFKIPIPDLKTQDEIVQEIERIVSTINLAISKAQKEISSIKEYREALITDLVTGKRSIPQLQMS